LYEPHITVETVPPFLVLYGKEIVLYSSLLRFLVFNSKGNEMMFRVHRQEKRESKKHFQSGMDGKRALLT
jgi:hypothetical protein